MDEQSVVARGIIIIWRFIYCDVQVYYIYNIGGSRLKCFLSGFE